MFIVSRLYLHRVLQLDVARLQGHGTRESSFFRKLNGL